MIEVLQDGIRILSRVIENKTDAFDSSEWLKQFSVGLQLLDDYDHEALDLIGSTAKKAMYPSMKEFEALVDQLRSEFSSGLF